MPGGADRRVVLDSLAEYVQLVTRVILHDGIKEQLAALQAGFNEVGVFALCAAMAADCPLCLKPSASATSPVFLMKWCPVFLCVRSSRQTSMDKEDSL